MTLFALSELAPTGLVAATFVAGGALGAAWSRRSAASQRVRLGSTDRRRTGRLPLPARVAALSPGDEPALQRVNAFVDRLAELRPAAWLRVGRTLAADTDATAARSAARAILDLIIDDRGLGVAAWYAKDAVETSAFLAQPPRARLTAADKRAFACAHGAAEVAALALLAEEHLAGEDFATLYRPFADLVPADATPI